MIHRQPLYRPKSSYTSSATLTDSIPTAFGECCHIERPGTLSGNIAQHTRPTLSMLCYAHCSQPRATFLSINHRK